MHVIAMSILKNPSLSSGWFFQNSVDSQSEGMDEDVAAIHHDSKYINLYSNKGAFVI